MKTIMIIAALMAALVLPAHAAHVTPETGYAVSETTISGIVRGFDVLSNGNFVVLEGSDTDASYREITKLYIMRPDGTKVGSDLYTFSARTYGSFATVDPLHNKVYFGESITGTVKSINLDGTGLADVATWNGNYDLAINSSGDKLLIAGSDIVVLDGTKTVVSAASPYSGPLGFDAAGNLYYGTAGNQAGQSILKWSDTQVTGAINGSPLVPDDGEALLTGLNTVSGLAASGSDLYFSEDGWSGPWNLNKFSGGVSSRIATGDDWLGVVRVNSANGAVSVAVGGTIATISTAPVPEPTSLFALAAGVGTIVLRRRGR